MHEVVQKSVSPKTALSVGLKVDAAAIPPDVAQAIKAGQVDLESPATTVIDGHWGFGFYVNAKAMELIITGRRIDAREAERIGLANEVVPEGKALERATELANEIAAAHIAQGSSVTQRSQSSSRFSRRPDAAARKASSSACAGLAYSSLPSPVLIETASGMKVIEYRPTAALTYTPSIIGVILLAVASDATASAAMAMTLPIRLP